jgi:alpha-tubulin suppressor-like RCC1 family protein
LAGTASDGRTVTRVTVHRSSEPCCSDLTDTLAIVPGSVTAFSVTYQLTGDATYTFDVTAYDGSGNKSSKTLNVVADRAAPQLFVIAPVFAPTDSEPVNIDAIDLSATLFLGYTANGAAVQRVGSLSGIPSPYPVTPRPSFFATAFRPRIGSGASDVAFSIRDEVGNVATRSVRILRGPAIVKVVAGSGHWCARASDGVARCWGGNTHGELGDGTTNATLSPVPVAGGMRFRDIASGVSHTCGLTDVGELYCWGAIVWSIVANMTVPTAWSTTPVRMAPGLTFSSVALGAGHTCGLTANGKAYCWGLNYAGQVGDSTTTDRPDPTPVAGGLVFSLITAGTFHTCGLVAGGEAYCWGDNYRAQLGIGATVPAQQAAPTPVATSLRFSVLEGGNEQTCGIALGSGYCWGYTDSNRLGVGIGGPGVVTTPMRVQMDAPLRSISVFYESGCAIALSGEAYCWGNKNDGQLGTPFGNPVFGYEAYPILTAYGLTFTQVRTSVSGTCAVSTSGALYCWGSAGASFPGQPIVEP